MNRSDEFCGEREIEMYQVDAFSSRVFGGNPAAVLLVPANFPAQLMQCIAMENNLSETAFVCRRGSGDYDLRWFTPVHEAAFCGHATLATAHVLAAELGQRGPFVFHTSVGLLTVSAESGGYVLDLPAFDPEPVSELPSELHGLFSRLPINIFRNFENVFVELPDEAEVREFNPDLQKIALIGPLGLVVTAQGESVDFVSRYFAPFAGIPEDPVTGSTHSTLVPYWSAQLGKSSLVALQCSKRGGHLECSMVGDRVRLTGSAITYFSGKVRLDSATCGQMGGCANLKS